MVKELKRNPDLSRDDGRYSLCSSLTLRFSLVFVHHTSIPTMTATSRSGSFSLLIQARARAQSPTERQSFRYSRAMSFARALLSEQYQAPPHRLTRQILHYVCTSTTHKAYVPRLPGLRHAVSLKASGQFPAPLYPRPSCSLRSSLNSARFLLTLVLFKPTDKTG